MRSPHSLVRPSTISQLCDFRIVWLTAPSGCWFLNSILSLAPGVLPPLSIQPKTQGNLSTDFRNPFFFIAPSFLGPSSPECQSVSNSARSLGASWSSLPTSGSGKCRQAASLSDERTYVLSFTSLREHSCAVGDGRGGQLGWYYVVVLDRKQKSYLKKQKFGGLFISSTI